VGIALLVVPGVVLWLTPPAFMYGTVAALVWRGLERFPRWRLAPTAIAVAAVAVGPPWIMNSRLDKATAALKQADMKLVQRPTLRDTIAFFFPQTQESGGRKGIECTEICQRLLYNGAVRRVIVAVSPDSLDGDLPRAALTDFHVERKADCPKVSMTASPPWQEYWPEGALADRTHIHVSRRIASGECLIQGFRETGGRGVYLCRAHRQIGRANIELVAFGDPPKRASQRIACPFRK
jgi:hypothetical protein